MSDVTREALEQKVRALAEQRTALELRVAALEAALAAKDARIQALELDLEGAAHNATQDRWDEWVRG